MKRLTAALRGLATLALLCPTIGAQQPSPAERRVDSLFAQYPRGLAPGLAVTVERNGEMPFSKGYGYASLEHRVPISGATVFDVASVSKQFAGLGRTTRVKQRISAASLVSASGRSGLTPKLTCGRLSQDAGVARSH